MLVLQVLISIFTGIMSPLIWSMYADVSDYAELKFHTASTGLIFSSASMAQKFGGAIGGAGVMWLLSAVGYITDSAQLSAGVVQPESALLMLRWLMSFIPAAVAALAIIVVWFYPLTTKRIHEISSELKKVRAIE
jgi:GPH family glycoside/pentoside/hexuronide:cation symporter